MKYIISGGGTGGHIYPALAILEEIQKRDKKAEILYVGNKDSMEERLVEGKNLNFKTIRVKGMPRKINKDFFIGTKEMLVGLGQSRSLIKDFNPDIVIGTGGFVTGPVLLAGFLSKKKTLIHEQNSLPGITNRILSKFVSKACVTYESSIRYFAKADRAVVTGNPIRANFTNLKRDASLYKKFSLSQDLPIVFVFGGSNGSRNINKALADMLVNSQDLDFQLIIATGRDNYDSFTRAIKNTGFKDKISVHDYMDDIGAAYALADLVITSSGAISLAEISSLGLASILIPKAYTAENHQEFNARLYKDAGASDMILEAELDWRILLKKINNILDNDKSLKLMGENAKQFANPRATSDIVDEIEKLIGGSEDGRK